MSVQLRYRPLDSWPRGRLTPEHERQQSRFDATWEATLNQLDIEVAHLTGKNRRSWTVFEPDLVIVQLATRNGERDFRIDGGLRADAKIIHPGVVISLEASRGPLRFACDRFSSPWKRDWNQSWRHNFRAIVLGLEALRKVERYGIAGDDEQYRGFAALPSGTPMGPATSTPDRKLTLEEAGELLARLANEAHGDVWVNDDDLVYAADRVECIRGAFRDAVRLAHPDAGGDPATFRLLTQARDLLLANANAA